MIKTVLFDKDGTLFDFRATWSGFAKALLEDLSSGDPLKAAAMSNDLDYNLETGEFFPGSVLVSGTPGDIASCLLPHLPGTSPAGLIARMNVLAANVPQCEVTPLQPLLESLRDRGLTLGVITNDAMAPTRAHLRAVGVSHLFERIISCDCGFGQKPSPGQIHAFLEMTGAMPSETVMVGDAPSDLIAARAAGCISVGVLTGHATATQLAPHADKVLADVSELPELLDSWQEARTHAA